MPARVLIVDDEPPSARMLAAKLNGEYYDVLTAEDGPGALEAVRQQDPDLILLDVMLPGMDGYEVCRKIKQDPSTAHIPIVIVSALDERAHRVRGIEAGAEEFLTKPVDDITLFARIRSLVRLKQTLDQWRLRGETTQKMGFPNDDEMVAVDDGRTARAALVDESKEQSVVVSAALEKDHDHVSVVGSFKDAINRIIMVEPDVLIVGLTDIGDEALRLCSSLRSLEQTRPLPILLIGHENETDTLIKALELGVNDYMMRPLDEQELRARVRNLVRRKRYQDRLRTTFLQSLSMALTDSLTGLHNRRYFSSHLDALFRRTVESGKPLAVLMIDIDHFKQVNDIYGHAVGDEVLCDVAQSIARNVRAFDLVARFGGEEFVVVMPDTSADIARSVADRLREKIVQKDIIVADSAAAIEVTVSIGMSYARRDGDAPEELLKRADKALYRAKEEGRNRVVPEPAEDGEHILRVDVG